MTMREMFEKVIAGDVNEEVIAMCKKEIEKMDARNAKRAETPSKKAEENKPIKESIENFLMNCEEAKIASDIVAEVGFNVQKISSLCKQMVEEGRLVSEDIKVKGKGVRKAYKIAE